MLAATLPAQMTPTAEHNITKSFCMQTKLYYLHKLTALQKMVQFAGIVVQCLLTMSKQSITL